MYKFFRNIGLISFILACFLYTNKLVTVVKEYDEIMVQIKEKEKNYEINTVEAIIDEDTIIPGICGKKIDINSSYSKMRQYGKYEEKLLQYKYVDPKELLKNNKDKFIIKGNQNKKEVTLIFLINDIDKIDDIIKVINKNDIKANFFFKNNLINQKSYILDLINSKNIVGNLGNYDDASFLSLDKVIKKLGKQKNSYCYTEDKNKKTLEICSKENDYTIVPNIIVDKNNLMKLKKYISNGSIISIDNIDINTIEQLINYIKTKGYDIVTLEKLLSEK